MTSPTGIQELERFDETNIAGLIWDAIGFGIAVGQKVPELFSPRWEEGWERAITDWQDELGISELLKTSPFQDEFANIYGLNLE